MDIVVARTFLEVLKTGSFVAAAANLNITQTAVSARIRVLEEQLDRQLFVRNKAGARLTPAGQQFHRFATTLVQVWESAQRAVALPPGREQVVTIGAELSLWSPLLRHWLLWMRRESPSIAIRTSIDSAERLIGRVQDGSLDVAVLYGSPQRPGLISELLFEERLVLVRTTPVAQSLEPADHVEVHWGEDFAASYRAAFPEEPNPVLSISYGPLALEYILAAGGSGYFREGFVRSYLDEGRLALVLDAPEFSYSASVVHSTAADHAVMDKIRSGLRAAAAAAS
jgi:LysR family transcriptional regulator, flagellar master operon regulator